MSKIDYLNGDPAGCSRAELEQWIYELQDRLRSVTVDPADEELRRVIRAFGLPRTPARILVQLSDGRIATRDGLAAITSERAAEELHMRHSTGPAVIDVQICRIRKAVKPLGIEIETVRGIGYHIADFNCQKIKSVMRGKDVDLISFIVDIEHSQPRELIK